MRGAFRVLTKATLTLLFLGGVAAAFMSPGLAMEVAVELVMVTDNGMELELVEEKSADENVVGRDDDVGTDGRDERALDGEAAPG